MQKLPFRKSSHWMASRRRGYYFVERNKLAARDGIERGNFGIVNDDC